LFLIQLHSFGEMKSKFTTSIFIGLMICLSTQSCQETVQPEIDKSLINGKWLVVSSKRNSKPTTTVNEAYFVFSPDSTMQTNFTGDDVSSKFSLNTRKINQHSEENLSYDILKLTRDTLVLKTSILNYDFEFHMLNERLDPFDKMNEELENIEPVPAVEDHEPHES